MHKVVLIIVSCLSFQLAFAQIITKQAKGYGLTDEYSGEQILEHKFDSIYQLCFDFKAIYSSGKTNTCNSPLFVCEWNNKFRIFDAYESLFIGSEYDEVKLYQESMEQMYPYPKKYKVNYIDCVLLRQGNLWGYIGHQKTYHFHDALLKDDRFFICEPQYVFLKMITQADNFNSRQYIRKGRIMVAKKDSLYGALQFESAAEIVPFKYEYPIYRFNEKYDRRGLEFLSMEGGFVPYYCAGKGFDSDHQIIINAQGNDASFEFDYPLNFDIYYEFEKYYLYAVSKGLPNAELTIWDYGTGENIFKTTLVSSGENVQTKRINESILSVIENAAEYGRYEVKWYNLWSGELMLYFNDKKRFNFAGEFGLVEQDGQTFIYKKERTKLVGKLTGSGKDQKIEWFKKSYLPQ